MCLNQKHYEDILIWGSCATCGHRFSLEKQPEADEADYLNESAAEKGYQPEENVVSLAENKAFNHEN